MSGCVAANLSQRGLRPLSQPARRGKPKSAPPQAMRDYLLGGDHFRTGQRLKGSEPGPAVFTGLALNRGISDPMAHTTAFAEHLEQAWTEHKIGQALPAAAARYYRVEWALREVEEVKPEGAAALRYFARPFRRTVVVESGLQACDVQTLYNRREAAMVYLFDALGGVW